MIGEGARVLVERALTASGLVPFPADALDRFRAIYDRRLLDTTVPYDGVSDLLAAAAPLARLAVLTNKPLAPSQRLLMALGLAPHFTWILGGDGPHPRKPDPAGLVWLMQQAGTSPPQTLFVGDSSIDVQTAQRAGVLICGVRYGFGWGRGGVDLSSVVLADTPADVLGVIQARLSL
jgi:phosphoglycolate phosphatase